MKEHFICINLQQTELDTKDCINLCIFSLTLKNITPKLKGCSMTSRLRARYFIPFITCMRVSGVCVGVYT